MTADNTSSSRDTDGLAGGQGLAPTVTQQSRVACNGGGGPLGHPQIWLNLGTDGSVTCPYCSRQFGKAEG